MRCAQSASILRTEIPYRQRDTILRKSDIAAVLHAQSKVDVVHGGMESSFEPLGFLATGPSDGP